MENKRSRLERVLPMVKILECGFAAQVAVMTVGEYFSWQPSGTRVVVKNLRMVL